MHGDADGGQWHIAADLQLHGCVWGNGGGLANSTTVGNSCQRCLQGLGVIVVVNEEQSRSQRLGIGVIDYQFVDASGQTAELHCRFAFDTLKLYQFSSTHHHIGSGADAFAANVGTVLGCIIGYRCAAFLCLGQGETPVAVVPMQP